MFKYMVVTMCDGNPYAGFFNDRLEAYRYKQDCECGLGAVAQLYILNKRGEYEFLFS